MTKLTASFFNGISNLSPHDTILRLMTLLENRDKNDPRRLCVETTTEKTSGGVICKLYTGYVLSPENSTLLFTSNVGKVYVVDPNLTELEPILRVVLSTRYKDIVDRYEIKGNLEFYKLVYNNLGSSFLPKINNVGYYRTALSDYLAKNSNETQPLNDVSNEVEYLSNIKLLIEHLLTAHNAGLTNCIILKDLKCKSVDFPKIKSTLKDMNLPNVKIGVKLHKVQYKETITRFKIKLKKI